jgi:hypothetical protein
MDMSARSPDEEMLASAYTGIEFPLSKSWGAYWKRLGGFAEENLRGGRPATSRGLPFRDCARRISNYIDVGVVWYCLQRSVFTRAFSYEGIQA